MNILVWTDRDLDGAGSALAIKWLYGSKADTFIVHEVTGITLSGKFKGALGTLDHYDKIYVLDRGSIIESGNHENLMKQKGHYYNLYNSKCFY